MSNELPAERFPGATPADGVSAAEPSAECPLSVPGSESPELPADDKIPRAEERERNSARQRSTLRDYLESFLVTVILALFGTTFVVQAFKIPSPSMEPTLLVGDHLLVNKFIYGGRGAWYEKVLPYKPVERGDIVVFKFPYDDHSHYVKRVIGTPGDRIRIVDQQLFVNGKPIEEPYKVHDPSNPDPYGDNFPPASRIYYRSKVRPEWAQMMPLYVEAGELVVPQNKYFVMGDNRDWSWDSRYWGFVDREAIMGRPAMIYFSVEATSEDYADRSLAGRLIGMAHTITHLPAKTRWDRMFSSVR
jgi:signal peptidase I